MKKRILMILILASASLMGGNLWAEDVRESVITRVDCWECTPPPCLGEPTYHTPRPYYKYLSITLNTTAKLTQKCPSNIEELGYWDSNLGFKLNKDISLSAYEEAGCLEVQRLDEHDWMNTLPPCF